jgi:hypothetical protein
LHFVEIVATSPQYYALELYIFIFIYISIICYLLITKTASHDMCFPTKSGLVSVTAEFMERCGNIFMCRKYIGKSIIMRNVAINFISIQIENLH